MEELVCVILRFKNRKLPEADRITTELFKYEGDMLHCTITE